jgi:Fe2+ or Zn2+ uptake regulation protein
MSHSHPAAQSWLERLQSSGYRITDPRRSVVEVIVASDRVLSPLDVYERARQIYPSLGLVTVYRTIEKLEELDLIQRVHQPSGCQAFVASAEGHQHLIICQVCGRVEFFSGEYEKLESLMSSVAQGSGFTVSDHWLQLFGACRECQGRKDELKEAL